MSEEKKEESLPIGPPLKVVDYRTVGKGFAWWSAVVLLESWGRRIISFYLWQKKEDKWRRKQKFTVQSAKKWEKISQAIQELLPGLNKPR